MRRLLPFHPAIINRKSAEEERFERDYRRVPVSRTGRYIPVAERNLFQLHCQIRRNPGSSRLERAVQGCAAQMQNCRRMHAERMASCRI